MHAVEKAIWIACSPQDVFAIHANHANRVDWHEHVTRSEKVRPGPLGVGTCFDIDTIMAKRPLPMTIEIIAFDPPDYYAYRSTASSAITNNHQTFTPENGGTRFQVWIELHFRRLVKPFGWFILKLMLEKHFEEALQELKQEMER